MSNDSNNPNREGGAGDKSAARDFIRLQKFKGVRVPEDDQNLLFRRLAERSRLAAVSQLNRVGNKLKDESE